MMNIENIRKELNRQGIQMDLEECCIVKNGVQCKAIRLINAVNGNVYPVIYYSELETVSEIAARVYDAVYRYKPRIDSSRLTDPEYILDHVYVGIQRRSDEELVKKPLLNLELILRIYLDLGSEIGTGTVKVTQNLLRCTDGLTEEKLWKKAMENSRSLYRIRAMGEIFGIEENGYGKLFVGTSDTLTDAASIIAFPEYARNFCNEHACVECFILPSSTQEMIFLPGGFSDGEEDPQVMAEMVREINESQVDPVIRLEPCCYRYRLATDAVEIAAVTED